MPWPPPDSHHYHELFEPIPEGFTYVDFNDVEAVMNATTENTVAVMVEPVQGEGGVNIPDADYFQRLRAWCDQNDILLILDEVQTGMGSPGEPVRPPGIRRGTRRDDPG